MIKVIHQANEYKGWLWKLSEAFPFEYNEKLYIIPVGFKTDFASVPKPLWSFIPSIGTYCEPSLKHDYFYTTKLVKRKEADKFFYQDMIRIQPKRKLRAFVMYTAVRIFGWFRWGKNRWNPNLITESYDIKKES